MPHNSGHNSQDNQPNPFGCRNRPRPRRHPFPSYNTVASLSIPNWPLNTLFLFLDTTSVPFVSCYRPCLSFTSYSPSTALAPVVPPPTAQRSPASPSLAAHLLQLPGPVPLSRGRLARRVIPPQRDQTLPGRRTYTIRGASLRTSFWRRLEHESAPEKPRPREPYQLNPRDGSHRYCSLPLPPLLECPVRPVAS